MCMQLPPPLLALPLLALPPRPSHTQCHALPTARPALCRSSLKALAPNTSAGETKLLIDHNHGIECSLTLMPRRQCHSACGGLLMSCASTPCSAQPALLLAAAVAAVTVAAAAVAFAVTAALAGAAGLDELRGRRPRPSAARAQAGRQGVRGEV
jgi:hypothetical protein